MMKVAEKNNVPELRFPGFEQCWKLHRLEDVVDHFKSGQGITASEISDVAYVFPFLRASVQREHSDLNDQYFHSRTRTLRLHP